MQKLRKDGLSMREYLTKMKTYYDLLEATCHKVSETKHVISIMNGLDEEYEAVVAIISSKERLLCNMFIPHYLLMRVD